MAYSWDQQQPAPTYGLPSWTQNGVGGAAAGGLGAALGGPLGWASLGLGTVGGIASGISQAQEARKQREFEARQRQMDRNLQQYTFDRGQGFNENQYAMEQQRSLDNAPMRDRAIYMLQARMGMTPGNFAPGNIFQPGSLGGINQNQLAQHNANYYPGAGGTANTQAMQQMYVNRFNTPGPRGPAPVSGPPTRPRGLNAGGR